MRIAAIFLLLLPALTASPMISNLIMRAVNVNGGSTATLRAHYATPGSTIYFCYSMAGTGPTPTPYGFSLDLSPPIGGGLAPGWSETVNANGEAMIYVGVPAGLTGALVWGQAIENDGGVFSISPVIDGVVG